METPINLIEELVDRAESYGQTTFKLAKLKTLESITSVAATLVVRVSVFVMIILFVLILHMGIALWLGELLGKTYYGFFIVAAFILMEAIGMHFFLRRWIKKPISDFIITEALR